ncbi:MAG: siderophore ferric iron reductase [Neisseria sp.]|nr:siderophore ferric iron reductase [Neisseria sp.]
MSLNLKLSCVVARCAETLPALAGEIRPSESPADWLVHESAEMAKIHANLKREYAHAGEVYWGCRAWQLWIWQPVYLAVWAAAVWRVAPDLGGFRHRMGEVFTDAYTLPEQMLAAQAAQQAVLQTALHLQGWMQRQRSLILPHYPLADKLAQYFLGDTVLKALAAAQRFGLMDKEAALQQQQWWQAALDCRCQGRLVWLEAERGFQVEMAACCQHYRCHEGTLCTGCPKSRKQQRECGC